MVIHLEAMLSLYHNSHTIEAEGACHDPEVGEIKVQRNKDEAANGKLDLSDAEVVQDFSTSEATPLNDHRDRRHDWDVLSPDPRPGTYHSEAV